LQLIEVMPRLKLHEQLSVCDEHEMVPHVQVPDEGHVWSAQQMPPGMVVWSQRVVAWPRMLSVEHWHHPIVRSSEQ
jgi:hypothetical protein